MTRNLRGGMRLWIQIAASIALLFGWDCIRESTQAVGATLSGTITDQSGGVVPNANVAILNTATGTRELYDNVDGIYSAPNLQPEPTASQPRQRLSEDGQNGLTLTVGARRH